MKAMVRGQILNMERYRQAKFIDFSGLLGAFPNQNISPSDIDFIVERHGRFLIGEIKLRGTLVPTGQKILLDALLAGLKGCWVFEAEHNRPIGEMIHLAECSVTQCRSIYPSGLRVKLYEPGEMSVLALCERWTDTFH